MGSTRPQTAGLVQRLRALSRPWSISRREARWVAEQQAKLLISEAGITVPPVPTRIVTELDGVNVYSLRQMPVKGLLSASKPSSRGGDILIDSTLPPIERRVTLMHELKHIIDGSQSGSEGLCTDFAMSVLIPATWLRDDWQAGHRSVSALAERYQVPADAVAHRLHDLGLPKRRLRQRRRSYCQWQPYTHDQRKRSSR